MSYVGNTPTTQSFLSGTDQFTGNGVSTNWTLSRFVNTVNDIEVVIANVEQNPTSYSVSGNTLTISPAVSNGVAFYVRYLSTTLQSIGPGQGSVGTLQLQDSSVTTAKIADANVTTAKIADSSITTAKIADNAITTQKIAAGAVIPADLSTGAPSWNSSGDVTISRSVTVNGSEGVAGQVMVSSGPATPTRWNSGALVYAIPNTGGATSWIRLGTFTGGQNGQHLFIRITSAQGYNADPNQNCDTFVHFKTSNGSSNAAGFYGDMYMWRVTNSTISPTPVRAVQLSLSSFEIWGLFQPFSGDGSFYEVTVPPTATWVNSGTNTGSTAPTGTTYDAVDITYAQTYIATANLTAGGLGTYAYAITTSAPSSISYNSTWSANTLRAQGYIQNGSNSNVVMYQLDGQLLAGTWRSLGSGGYIAGRYWTTLFVRIA